MAGWGDLALRIAQSQSRQEPEGNPLHLQDDEDEALEQAAASAVPLDDANCPWNRPKKQYSARRSGRKGSHAFRAALRDVRANPFPQPEHQRAEEAHPLPAGQDVVPFIEPVLDSHQIQPVLDRVPIESMDSGTSLQCKVMILAMKHFGWQSGNDAIQSTKKFDQTCPVSELEQVHLITERLLFNFGTRPSMTLRAEAAMCSVGLNAMRRNLIAAAAALQASGTQAWNVWFGRILQLQQHERMACVMTVISRSYDETPLKIRLDEIQGHSQARKSGAQATARETAIAKVLQTRVKVGWLLKVIDEDSKDRCFQRAEFAARAVMDPGLLDSWTPRRLESRRLDTKTLDSRL